MFDKKEWSKEYNKQYYKKNIKKVKAWNRKCYIENREERLIWGRNYYQRNEEKRKEYQIAYRQTEEGKATHQRGKTKRRIKMREIVNTLTSQEWEDILEKYNYKCAYCGIEFNCENLPTYDHFIPLSRGGHNTKENIVPACRSCNAKKHNKIL